MMTTLALCLLMLLIPVSNAGYPVLPDPAVMVLPKPGFLIDIPVAQAVCETQVRSCAACYRMDLGTSPDEIRCHACKDGLYAQPNQLSCAPDCPPEFLADANNGACIKCTAGRVVDRVNNRCVTPEPCFDEQNGMRSETRVGRQVPDANTKEECEQACTDISSGKPCYAYGFSESDGSCELYEDSGYADHSVQDKIWAQYVRSICVPDQAGECFREMKGTRSNNGEEVTSAETKEQCEAACLSTDESSTPCYAFDFRPKVNKCVIQRDITFEIYRKDASKWTQYIRSSCTPLLCPPPLTRTGDTCQKCVSPYYEPQEGASCKRCEDNIKNCNECSFDTSGDLKCSFCLWPSYLQPDGRSCDMDCPEGYIKGAAGERCVPTPTSRGTFEDIANVLPGPLQQKLGRLVGLRGNIGVPPLGNE